MTMTSDPWHYPRTELAKQILGMFSSGLSTALVFFAPRRMGKTEFICKDIAPLAEQQDWKVFYFSFLDVSDTAASRFTQALAEYTESCGKFPKARSLLKRVSNLTAEAAGFKASIELPTLKNHPDIKAIITQLAAYSPVLLLLDEVQVLALAETNANFIAALRTALDRHKDQIKVIFTGSSQQGLRQMFSQAKAPFFHFGQNLPFPELDQGFTEHLAKMFERVTQRSLDSTQLWSAFQEMQKIPQLARALVERLALHPDLSFETIKTQLMTEVFYERGFANFWEQATPLEQLLLKAILVQTPSLFSSETRASFAKALGIEKLSVSSTQSALRTLLRKGIIGKLSERGDYYIEDPSFKNWLTQTNLLTSPTAPAIDNLD